MLYFDFGRVTFNSHKFYKLIRGKNMTHKTWHMYTVCIVINQIKKTRFVESFNCYATNVNKKWQELC